MSRRSCLAAVCWLALAALLQLSCATEAPPIPSSDMPEIDDTQGVEPPPDLPAAPDAGPNACLPVCPLSACANNDGCQSLCPPCPSTLSCADCLLRLSIIDTTEKAGVVSQVRLALDYFPTDLTPLPRVADIRLRAQGAHKWLDVQPGQALNDAQKSLAGAPDTGSPYQLLEDGVIRVVVLSDNSNDHIGAGRLLTWDLLLGAPFAPPTEPVVIRLIRDEPIFAPPEADVNAPAITTLIAIWPPE